MLDLSIDTSGRLLAIGSTNGAVQVFDLKSGNTTHMFTNNKGPIVRLAFHPHPQKLYLVSLSEDLTLRIFDLVVNRYNIITSTAVYIYIYIYIYI